MLGHLGVSLLHTGNGFAQNYMFHSPMQIDLHIGPGVGYWNLDSETSIKNIIDLNRMYTLTILCDSEPW